ncbi:MAG: toll/interleukin-1 receptor domain-containing protein [Pseudomonadota bacterium]
MLVVVQIPVFDPRGLIFGQKQAEQTRRLAKPPWAFPKEIRDFDELGKPTFLRSAGAVVARKATGLRGTFAEDVFCRANKAAKLPNITAIDLTNVEEDYFVRVWPRVRFRNFFHDGRLLGKFEIGFNVQGEDQLRAVLNTGARPFADHLLSQLVSVRGAQQPVTSLMESGPSFAEFYDRASTSHPRFMQRVRAWLGRETETPKCRAGTPLVTFSVAKGALVESVTSNQVAEWKNSRVYAWQAEVRGRRAECVMISENSDRTSEETRSLRIFLNRMHAELAAAEAVLDDAQGTLAKSPPRREINAVRERMKWYDRFRFDRIQELCSRIAVQTRLLGGPNDGEQVLSLIWGDRYVDLNARRESVWADLSLQGGAKPAKQVSFQRKRIFISYRQKDDRKLALKLKKYLANALPTGEVFLDQDLPWGGDWKRGIEKAIRSFDVVIALMGPNWVADNGTTRRIDEPHDAVRREIEIALKRDIPIRPVMTGGAGFPMDLPDSIAALKDIQGRSLQLGKTFESGARDLLESIVG